MRNRYVVCSGPECTDARTHNAVNELTQRSLTGGTSATYSPSFDAVGNMTNDGKSYKYEYDPFGRLTAVRNRTNDALVASYTYNGLGHRTGVRQDWNASGSITTDDKWYFQVYDESWRMIAVARRSCGSGAGGASG